MCSESVSEGSVTTAGVRFLLTGGKSSDEEELVLLRFDRGAAPISPWNIDLGGLATGLCDGLDDSSTVEEVGSALRVRRGSGRGTDLVASGPACGGAKSDRGTESVAPILLAFSTAFPRLPFRPRWIFLGEFSSSNLSVSEENLVSRRSDGEWLGFSTSGLGSTSSNMFAPAGGIDVSKGWQSLDLRYPFNGNPLESQGTDTVFSEM